MSKFLFYDKVRLEAHENYQKGGFRNRTSIVASGGIETLSVPLRSGKHQQKPIREVEIAYDESWHVAHWRSIATAYGRAPYFEHYGPALKDILDAKPKYLFELNTKCLEWLCKTIGLSTFELSDTFEKVSLNAVDLRNTIKPSKHFDDPDFREVRYFQMFDDRQEFAANLSVIDLLFALGPETRTHLRRSLILGC